MLVNELIKLYFHVCNKYKEKLWCDVQRFSNNTRPSGIISDEELITIYLFCVVYEERFKIKSMHKYIKAHWHDWFPLLPSYQAFNNRLNHLVPAFELLLIDFMSSVSLPNGSLKILLGDSFPIMTCSHKRQGKVATELTDKGFCATKNLHYYGVKLHTLGLNRASALPIPQFVEITKASVHDLTASKEILQKINADVCILDKAYADTELAKTMEQNNNVLLTPIKDKKGWEAALRQSDKAYNEIFNRAISAVRQPIESFFNWVNELTELQKASKVRSANGLHLHIYGKLTAALIMITKF